MYAKWQLYTQYINTPWEGWKVKAENGKEPDQHEVGPSGSGPHGSRQQHEQQQEDQAGNTALQEGLRLTRFAKDNRRPPLATSWSG